MANQAIDAIQGGKIADLHAAVKADPKIARHAGSIVEAARAAYRRPHRIAPARRERVACLKWLLEHGADPQLTAGWPPARAILIAAFVGEPEYVKRLKKEGGDFFAAAALGDRRAVATAIARRPEFTRERDANGLTALHCAAASRLDAEATTEVARPGTINWMRPISRHRRTTRRCSRCCWSAARMRRKRWSMPGPGEEFGELALAYGAVPDRAVADGKPLLNHLIAGARVRGHCGCRRAERVPISPTPGAGRPFARRDLEGRTPQDVARSAKKTDDGKRSSVPLKTEVG